MRSFAQIKFNAQPVGDVLSASLESDKVAGGSPEKIRRRAKNVRPGGALYQSGPEIPTTDK